MMFHGKGNIEIALVHPVDVALRALLCSPHKFFIAALRLAEYLDDFNAADVLHRCVVERIGRCDGAGIVLVIARHHEREEDHTQRKRDQGSKRHAPVQNEQIHKRCQNDHGVAAHLGNHMRQRRLDGIHTLDQSVLELAGPSRLHIAKRHAGELFKPLFSDIAEHRKRRLVRLRCGQRMKQHPRAPERCHLRAVDQIAGQIPISGKQLADHPRHHKKRQNLKRRADNGKCDAGDIPRLFLPGKGKIQPKVLFFPAYSHLT